MTFIEVRKKVPALLSRYLEIPIVLSDQTDEEPPVPFGMYSVTNSRGGAPYFGDHVLQVDENGLQDVRREQVTATFSFTFVSQNRGGVFDNIYGDDEAQELTEKAVGFFAQSGYSVLSSVGVVVSDILDIGNRSFLQTDEVSCQYGFDVVLRYARTDKMKQEAIAACSYKEKKKEVIE